MQNFSDLVTYQAHKIEQILISDLHLPLIKPVSDNSGQAFLAQAFLKFLESCLNLPNLKRLYVLGDWFEIWLGDDVANTANVKAWLEPVLIRLGQLSKQGCDILVMVGNRDFLLGQRFCDKFDATLIKAPYSITVASKIIRLEHGDALCTDDKNYQRFRNVVQNPLTKKILLTLPIKKRAKIAQQLRQKSHRDNAQKSMQIMDVNAKAVQNALNHSDILIHGHTHRPTIHCIEDKQRIVLGDWRVQKNNVVAEIGVIIEGKLGLVNFETVVGTY